MVKTRFFDWDDLVNDPGAASGFEQRVGANNVGVHEDTRVEDGAIHVRFGGKIDYGIDFVFAENLIQQGTVGDVPLNEQVPLRVREVFQVLQAAGISQRVEVDDIDVRVLLQQVVDEV